MPATLSPLSPTAQVTIFAYDAYVHVERGAGARNKTVGQARVLAKAWDLGLGGHAFDRLLLNYAADAFNADATKARALPASAGGDLRRVPSAMAKMRKNVVKTKEVLSANEEYQMFVESVLPDVDLRVPLSRALLERLAAEAGLQRRMTAVIDAALAQARLELGAINALEIVGGGVRMPLVQRTLRTFLADAGVAAPEQAASPPAAAGEGEEAAATNATGPAAAVVGVVFGQHLNGDESMALGAAFAAANRSSAFRVRKVGMVDAYPFGIGVRVSILPNETAAAGEEAAATAAAAAKPWSKRSALFPPLNHVESVKRVSFSVDRDLRAVLFYEAEATDAASPPLPPGTSRTLGAYYITGIASLIEEQTARDVERARALADAGLASPLPPANGSAAAAAVGSASQPKVHLSFELDYSGVVRLVRAEAVIDVVERQLAPVPKRSAAAASPNATANATDVNATALNATAANSSSTAANVTAGGDAAESSSATLNASTSPTAVAEEGTAANASSSTNVTATYIAVRRTLRFTLVVEDDSSSALSVSPLSAAQRAASREVLARLDRADEERRLREGAKNAVEAYIYATREKLTAAEEEEAEAADADTALDVSTPEQREALKVALSDAADWLYEEGHDTDTETYKACVGERGLGAAASGAADGSYASTLLLPPPASSRQPPQASPRPRRAHPDPPRGAPRAPAHHQGRQVIHRLVARRHRGLGRDAPADYGERDGRRDDASRRL